MWNDSLLSHRSIQEDDVSLLCDFVQDKKELFFYFPSASYPISEKQFYAGIKNNHSRTVVLKENQLAGFANLYRLEEKKRCWIGNVIVNPKMHRQGVGRYLIKLMQNQAFTNSKVEEVCIAAFNHNIGSLLLYTELGFSPFAIEEQKGKDGERVALINMRISKRKWITQ